MAESGGIMMTRRQRWIVLGLLAVTLVGFVGVTAFLWGREQGRRPSPLPVYGSVPDFELTERSGRTVRLADLKGRIWVADFIFTSCAGPCPMLSQQMSGFQTALARAPEIRLVSFSVDPERDTPAVLSEYAARYKADRERWLFLTGDRTTVYRLIREGFRLTVEEEPESEGQILHSLRFALVDRAGQVRGYYNGDDPESLRRLLPDVDRLFREDAS
ncbi:MAG: redoxin domain-containing protein [Candidatus Latescibacteria bacterium]|nr:redoxin domain-containing protein [Candidatus Latescibacterota bacterium]